MTGNDTLPRLLLRNARDLADKTAMREKQHGVWQALTWSEQAEATLALARGLAALGFCRGDRLAVLGDNRRALYQAQLAAMVLGGAAVPCWPDADTDWLARVLADANVSVVVAEDHDQVEKLLEIKDRLPALRDIIHTDPRGVHHEGLGFLHALADVVSAGATTGTDIASVIDAGQADDVCLVLHVTGGTGALTAVAVTHAQLIAAATAITQAVEVRQTDEYLSYLPMAWEAEALHGTALPLLAGFACSCPEDPETARRDLRELGPTILLAPPRIWASLLAEIESKAVHATPLKRRLCAGFLPDAYSLTPPVRAGFLGEWLVAAPLRDQLGLGRLRWAHMGGLQPEPHVHAFFAAAGVSLSRGPSLSDQPGLAGLAIDTTDPIEVASGVAVDPRPIEAALCHNGIVADAVVQGDGKGRLAALLALDMGALIDWAQARGLSFTAAADLPALPDVRALIRETVTRANARLPANQRIGRYRLLDSPPASTSAEASLSRILRRRVALRADARQSGDLFADPPATGVELLLDPPVGTRELAA